MRKLFLLLLCYSCILAYADEDGEIWVDGQHAEGHIIQEEGTSIRQDPFLNFVGPDVVASTVSGKSTITIDTTITGDATYLRLDTTNDPLTADLSLDAGSGNSPDLNLVGYGSATLSGDIRYTPAGAVDYGYLDFINNDGSSGGLRFYPNGTASKYMYVYVSGNDIVYTTRTAPSGFQLVAPNGTPVSANGSSITMQAGNGTASGGSGTGGHTYSYAGNGSGTNKDGGNVYLRPGTATGSGIAGTTRFQRGSIIAELDSQGMYWGVAQDAYIEFDGDSLNVVANAITGTDTLEMTAGGFQFITGNVGINTAPVSNQLVTLDYTQSTVNTTCIGNDLTLTHSSDTSVSTNGYGYYLDHNISGTDTTASTGKQSYGCYIDMDDTSVVNNASLTHRSYGIYSIVTWGGTNTNNQILATYGQYLVATGNMGTTGNTQHYGFYALVSGTADTNYGAFLHAQDATTNWALYVSAGNVFMGTDNKTTYWGTGKDASMLFNGSGFIIRSDEITATDYLQLRGGTDGIDFNIGATEEMTLTATTLDVKSNNITTIGIITGEQLTSTDDITLTGLLTDTSGTVDISSNNLTTTGDIRITVDNAQLEIGALAGGDLTLIHDSTNSEIVNNTGDLRIENKTSDEDIIFEYNDGGAAKNWTFDASEHKLITTDGNLQVSSSYASGGTMAIGTIPNDHRALNISWSGMSAAGETFYGIYAYCINAAVDNNIIGFHFDGLSFAGDGWGIETIGGTASGNAIGIRATAWDFGAPGIAKCVELYAYDASTDWALYVIDSLPSWHSGNFLIGGTDSAPNITLSSSGDVIIGTDNNKLEIGLLAGGDLQLYHNATNSYIDNVTGDLYIKLADAGAANKLSIRDSGDVEVASVDSDGTLTCGGSSSGQSLIGAGLVVNNDQGNAANDDFKAKTTGSAAALHVDAANNIVEVGAGVEFKGGRYACEWRDYSSITDNNYVQRNILEVSDATNCAFQAPWAGSIVGISITSGTTPGVYATYPIYEVRINGVGTGLTATFANGDANDYATQARDADTFSAGDLIQVHVNDWTYTSGNTIQHVTITVFMYFDD